MSGFRLKKDFMIKYVIEFPLLTIPTTCGSHFKSHEVVIPRFCCNDTDVDVFHLFVCKLRVRLLTIDGKMNYY